MNNKCVSGFTSVLPAGFAGDAALVITIGALLMGVNASMADGSRALYGANHEYLRELGAAAFIGRDELALESNRPLQRERWAAAVDTVGSSTLGNVLSQVRYRGAVAACGLAGGADLPTTVMPFILRGIKRIGVDSLHCPGEIRAHAWERLSTDLPPDLLRAASSMRSFDDIPKLAEDIVAGRTRGRVVVKIAQ